MRKSRGIPVPPSASLRATSFTPARRPSSNEKLDSYSASNIFGVRPSNSLDKAGFNLRKMTVDDLFGSQSDAAEPSNVIDPNTIDRFFDETQSAFASAFTPAPLNTESLTASQGIMAERTQHATTRLKRVTESVAELETGLAKLQGRISAADRNIAESQEKAQELSDQMEWMRERLSEVEEKREMSIRMMIIQSILFVVGYVSRIVIAVRNFVLSPVHFVQQKLDKRARQAPEPHKEERKSLRRSDDKREGRRRINEINLFASTGELPIVPDEVLEESPIAEQ